MKHHLQRGLLLTSLCMMTPIVVWAQSIRFNQREMPLKSVITQIERQTGMSVDYDASTVDVKRTVKTQDISNDVETTLNAMLKGTGLVCEVKGKHIIIRREETPADNKGGRRVNGTILDQEGNPVVGATVVAKGTGIGTITDVNGNYSIEVPEGCKTLQCSFLGYTQADIEIGNKSSLNVTLEEDSQLLDDVVVVGYGTQRKSDLTGSVQRANLDVVKNAPNANVVSSLQGAIPGLNIGQVNTAGGSANIEVRGQSTLSGNTNVLIVLDGIVYNGTMASLNPADIASIDVLKDASSKAIYGASAANGVLLITTKRGKAEGKPVINFSANLSSSTPSVKLHPMNREQKIKTYHDYFWKEGGYIQNQDGTYSINSSFDVASHLEGSQVAGYNSGADYNWLDEGTQNGYYMNYQLSVNNVTERSNLYISGAYTKQAGWIKNDDFDRKNIRINAETKVFPWMTLGVTSFGTFMDYSGASPSLYNLYQCSPLNTPYDENGDLIYSPSGSIENPYTVFFAKDRDLRNQLSGLMYFNIDFPFLKGLSYRLNWGNNYKWNKHSYSNEWGSNHKGSAYKTDDYTYDYTIDNILNYKTDIAKVHHIDVTAVIGQRSQKYDYTKADGQQYTDITLGYNNLEGATLQYISSDAWREQFLYQMGRVNYNYDNRYLLTATVRRDGYSGFSKNHRWGIFPSFALGWVISNEKFFQVDAVDNMKLRISYGSNGNMTTRYSTMAKMGSSSYVFGDGGSTAYAQYVASMAPDLKWESTRGMNYGIDLSLWRSRINLSIDLYNTDTDNLLWNVNIPTITGFSSIGANIGKINNRGLEITMAADVIRSKDWNWRVGVNFSHNKNEIKELLGDTDGDGKEDDLVASNLFVGHSINTVYDYNVLGLWSTEDEANGVIYAGSYVGCEKIEDLNGDGKIDATNDRKILGSKDPSFRASINSTLTYQNWTLTTVFNSVVGLGDNYMGSNNALSSLSNNSGDNFLKHNFFTEVNYWTPDNQDAEYRIPVKVPSVSPSHWRNRSFLRLQDISLTYNIKPALLNKLGIKSLSMSLTGKNLFTLTNWKGWDPETGDGLIYTAYPVMKSYSFGLNLSF